MTAPPFARHCSVYQKPGFFLIVCAHQAPSWIWKSGHPMQKLAPDTDTTALGVAVLDSLASSTQGKVADSREMDYSVPRFAGFRSWRALERDARNVSVHSDGVSVTATPQRYEKGAFFPIVEKAIKCSPTPDGVGTAVLEALKSCA